MQKNYLEVNTSENQDTPTPTQSRKHYRTRLGGQTHQVRRQEREENVLSHVFLTPVYARGHAQNSDKGTCCRLVRQERHLKNQRASATGFSDQTPRHHDTLERTPVWSVSHQTRQSDASSVSCILVGSSVCPGKASIMACKYSRT
mmetsp:Transcript_31515/g.84094  ORF Transcript_31515/g.84094 Transcript_31515/m.84094 type:complete len:145 (-) Transcript_31515:699-1133(-)